MHIISFDKFYLWLSGRAYRSGAAAAVETASESEIEAV